MKQLRCMIVENKKIAADFYKMRIESPYLARNLKPGQFVEVRCSENTDPLLPRPLGCHRILKNGIELLYEVVGNGTAMLSEKKAGGALNLIGPLGNGFNITASTKAAILIAGGIGVAPLLALAERLAYSGQRIAYSKKQKIHVFIGAKTKEHIICSEDFKKIGCDVSVSTEDGSSGHKGFITDLLLNFLNAKRYTLYANIYACGPTGMLKTVSKIAKEKRMPCQVSFEERMACGVGVCLGCPVKVRQLAGSPVSRLKPAHRHTGTPAHYVYKMVCKDGPVFNAEDIAW